MSGRRDESLVLDDSLDAIERLIEIGDLVRDEFDAAEAERDR